MTGNAAGDRDDQMLSSPPPGGTARYVQRAPVGRSRALLAAALLFLGLVFGLTPDSGQSQSLQPVPPLKSRVTDLTGTLDAQQVQTLEAALAELEQDEGAQVAVLMVPTTKPEAIEQYGIRVVDQWKLGRGKARAEQATGNPNAPPVDDGVLLLVAKEDRRMRIEVGYGLEGAIPDGIAKRIIDESIAPRFRQQDYFGGIQAGLKDLRARIEGEDLPPAWLPSNGKEPGAGVFGMLPVLVFAFVAGTILASMVGRFLGAGTAGLGAGVFGATAVGSTLLAVGAAILVFALVLLMAPSRSGLRRVGRHTYGNGPIILPGGWGGGGRGGGFGGGGGGFGGGGGGFGGGGGGFGGGGASGGW